MAQHKNILPRFFVIIILMMLTGAFIMIKVFIIMLKEDDYWRAVASRLVKENVVVKPTRGNILSADGQLMASSLPEYKIYIDFLAGGERKDSALMNHLDEICAGLHAIFPNKSAAEFKRHLLAGRRKKSRNYAIYPHRISYIQYKEAKRLPVFCWSRNAGGFYGEPYNQRKKPFGSLAQRTLGDMYPAIDSARSGLELAFDSLLRGTPGIMHRQKVMSKWLDIVDRPPVSGCDIVSTIDVNMQDIAEKALVDKLKEINANSGVAVLMEVETGDVKAIVNMTKVGEGVYREVRNDAIASMMEPGSTFKTASIMVALEDGYITPYDVVDTGNGVMKIGGRFMRDHNWHHGGYGKIDVTRILEVSSNVGVSYLINKYYQNQPQKFVDGLKRMSLDQPLHLQLPGEGIPNIKGPDEKYFAKTTLPWMSIGYETQLPPINILTFYNAIANGGKMVRPRFVTAAVKDNSVVEEYPVEVINPKICSDSTLNQIRTILRGVVEKGLAKPAGSTQFEVSGKTGTAQIWTAEGFSSRYLVSFCGYFPSEKPKYSCIVSIQIPHGPASGGLMAGSVFGRIAERVYAKDLTLDLKAAVDSLSQVIPDVKNGDLTETVQVLKALDRKVRWSSEESTKGRWGQARCDTGVVTLQSVEYGDKLVPNVYGMGAKDAVYLLERTGLRVRLHGKGKVSAQSIKAGTLVTKGAIIELTLRP